jgi:hypothetical protein
MHHRFALGVLALATTTVVLPAGVAAAQPRAVGQSPVRAAAAQRLSLAAVHLLTGTVRDQSGQALGDVCVLATGPGGQVKIARSGANGRYQLGLPRAGTYTVQYRACAPGKASVAGGASRQVELGASPVTTLPATALTRPGDTSLRTALGAAGIRVPGHLRAVIAGPGEEIVSGHARRAEAGGPPVAVITGHVTSPAGRPLAGICMWIVGKTFAAGTVTNKHGTYRLEIGGGGIPSRKYPVQFDSGCQNADPFVPIAPGRWAPQWYKDKFSPAKATKVLLQVNKTKRGINAVMQRAGEVSGTIFGSDHRRLKNACAVLTDSAGNEFGQAITNAKGQYTITGLDPGSYRLTALAACTGGANDYGQAWYPSAASVEKARSIRVRLGRRTSGINVVLPKLGTITGFVRLGGKTGKALGGMCVSAFSPTSIDVGGFATSQRSGKYVMEGLPAGKYQVEANVGGCGNNGNYAPAQYARAVRVSDTKTTSGIDLYMQPGGSLTGTITDAATDKPLAGICVGDDDGDFAVSGKDGTYKIDQLPAERTAVGFSGGCGNAGSYAPEYYDGHPVQEAANQVLITAGHVTSGINAAMLPGATLAGIVTGTSGRPVRGVCVAVVPASDLSFAEYFVGGNAITAANGSYSDANLAPGQYALSFFAGCEGPSNAAALQWFRGQPTANTAGLVSATAGQTVTGIDAVVARGGTIAGTITAGGQPVDFSCVTAISRATGQPAGFQALTGDGQYAISGLAAGSYRVFGSDCGGGNFAAYAFPRPVPVRAGHDTNKISLVVPRGGVITGRVTIAATGRAVAGACVEANPVSAAAVALEAGGLAFTGAAGTYRITGLNTGRYQIQVFAGCSGGPQNLVSVTLRQTVKVTQGKVTSGVDAALRAGGSISGQVTGPGAQAEPGTCVEFFQQPGGLQDVEVTDAHGKYTATGLAPGRYKVEFNAGECSDGALGLGPQWYKNVGSSGRATVITVKAGQTTGGINASLPADGTITGSVAGTGAAPLTGVCVSAVPVAGAEPTVYAVSGHGSYTLADLIPGRYRVEFQSGCGRSGLAAQWWDDAASSAAAKIVAVGAGATVSGVSALMTRG